MIASPFVQSMVFLAANALLATAVWRVAGRMAPRDRLAQRVMHALVLWRGGVTAATTTLGAVGVLTGERLVLLVAACSAAVLVAVRPPVDRSTGGRPPRRGWAWAAVGWSWLVASWGVRVATEGLGRFVTDFDTVMYHAPLVDYWLQAHSLHAPDSSHWSNPGGNELIGLWFVAPFDGDFLAVLANFPSALLLALAALELARLVGVRGPLAHLAGLTIATNVVVARQLVDAGNDVAVAGLMLATSYYGLRAAREGHSAIVALAAMSLGLLGGVKFYALGYAAVAWAAAVILTARSRGPGKAVRLGTVWIAGALAFGGYWYVRNAVVAGSPFYPLGISRESDLIGRVYPRILESTYFGNGRPEVLPLAARAAWGMTGPCQFLAVFGLPAWITWVLATGLRGRRGPSARSRYARLGLVLLTAGSALVVGVTPVTVEDKPGTLNQIQMGYTPARYGLTLMSLAVVAMTATLHDLAHLPRWRATRALPPLTFFLGLLTNLFIIGHGEFEHYRVGLIGYMTGFDLSLLGVAGYALGSRVPRLRRAVSVSAVVSAVAATPFALAWLDRDWHERYVRFYDTDCRTEAFHVLAGLDPAPTRVCLLDYRCYPFFGSRRQFHVFQPMEVASYERLRSYLRDRKIEVVAAHSQEINDPAAWDLYHQIAPWLTEHTQDFRVIHADPTFTLYRVHLSPADTPALLPDADRTSATSPEISGSNQARSATLAPAVTGAASPSMP